MISPSLVKKLEEAGLDVAEIDQRVAQALAEDAHGGDLTSKATISAEQTSSAKFVSRKTGVLSGHAFSCSCSGTLRNYQLRDSQR